MDAEVLGLDGLVNFRMIGSGGFATVYYAYDSRFGRDVAVKVLANLDEDGHRRFEREQLTMGRMTGHPNVVLAYHSGISTQGNPFLVMEFMSGGSLADLIDSQGPLSWDRAVRAILPIADALGHGHLEGIYHRDVKPANILIGSDGRTKLGDFGIAAIREGTATSARAFSLAHAPPETFAGGTDRRDERADLYSLASTLFQAVTKRAPYESETSDDSPQAYLARIAQHPIPTVGGDPRRDEFLQRALAKDPDDRPQNAAAFAADLQATIEPSPAPPPMWSSDTVEVSTTPSTPPLAEPDALVSPRPGWYEVNEAEMERYWDGRQWTADTRPIDPDHRVVPAPSGPGAPAEPLAPIPGWYDDPTGAPGVERLWNGSSWTDRNRPVTSA